MSRRRLRIVCSSSDDDEDIDVSLQPPEPASEPPLSHQIPPILVDDDEEEVRIDQISDDEVGITLQTMNLSSANSNSNSTSENDNLSRLNPSITQPTPFHISDDEMDDVFPDPGPVNPFNYGNNPVYDGINAILRKMGLGLKREWLEACIGALPSSIQGFLGLDDSQKAKLCFEQFLFADMNHCGSGVLPRDVHKLHLVDLKGPYILQVDEMVNISSPLRTRYQKAAPGSKRCLKLSMTDGVQRVFGMEYRPIKDLDVLSPAGMKIALCNVCVRRGILMLVPEVIEVLGGKVEELDAAKQRLVHEIEKPPRGRRAGMVQKLSERAALAAWPPETLNAQDPVNHSQTATMRFQVHVPGNLSGIPASDGIEEYQRGNVETNQSSMAGTSWVPFSTEQGQPDGSMNIEVNSIHVPSEEAQPNIEGDADVQEFQMIDHFEPPYMLTGERESPFTYLASLSAKWATMKDTVSKVQGKVKCFLTGVKGFQFKGRTTYELQAYIDDGSLITEIFIDHNVVQNRIGYSPEEVSDAVTSSDSSQASQMREILKQFQFFLLNFEGTMLVEMTAESSLHVAIEMDQGCSVSDAWSLLQRLRSSASTQRRQSSHLNATNQYPLI
ncbi:OLC1v1017720C1 [Oldenlandia corymbosa var. corymbosa]|uniref:RecQ-mediated genome instability protein 1 n=1 Tax=Oldenlandia corymbosa var. corymbosa TaxID=529605 RepID=A0AAV1EA23_OLDCO|nr:OLC1v1017720C1 [Oldenlandia corymbosa var. corymbosa]